MNTGVRRRSPWIITVNTVLEDFLPVRVDNKNKTANQNYKNNFTVLCCTELSFKNLFKQHVVTNLYKNIY